MRRLVGTLAALAISVVGVIGLIAFFSSRDESTTQGPARQATKAPASGDAQLKAGNIVLRYSDPAATGALRRLAGDLGAPDTPELRAAGQAVILRREPGVAGVEARALNADLAVSDPGDPALQAFVERWLGLGDRG